MTEQLAQVARTLVSPDRGILAADESLGTIGKRFSPIGVDNNEENRRAYRELLFTAPDIGKYISGVILFDETLRQSAADGTPFAQLLDAAGVVPGIKVDKGVQPLPGFPDETITEGLDGLRPRLEEYRELGARFAKWRATITIGDAIPTSYCLDANARALARYAALCHDTGLVPIVEPEVLMDGDNSLERCFDVTTATLRSLYAALADARVELEGTLLKPNMVVPGKKSGQTASPAEVADATIRGLRETVPAAVAGVVFLSGGQSEREATENLSAMNARGPHPWELSFSYGRALQASALDAWRGDTGNVEAAQRAFLHRARCNSAARTGSWTDAMESEAA
jgi:fructose-bisphosphate aldolase class I